ncbi:TetR/AcrR family transcriptional regulator [Inquilinus limosus]|uniref:Transcriptional regulator n=1 Tax=Inquilinus limosus MP06 TaxID=1398085 RepID=A0A0A0D7K7_9PROT|nr:TetR/AcrR family transcriptional regulator [Inquilinus limosus]KGM34119.1 transcriptional regulator [Inquilinus limosus MP06]
MEPDAKSRGGRPWSFDRDKAVETAMRLFWRHGYEGVSIGDLTKAIRIAPPSLYAAFGSKAGLYREALARYEDDVGALKMDPPGSAGTLAEAVRHLLEAAVRAVTHPDRERGCMISSGMITCHPEHESLARDLAARRDAMRERIAQALLPFADGGGTGRLARHLAAVMQGISIQVRDGASPAELQEIVDDVVAGVEARQPRAGSRP